MSFITDFVAQMEQKLNALRGKISNIYKYCSPWEKIEKAGSDPLGEFSFLNNEINAPAEVISYYGGYYRIREGVKGYRADGSARIAIPLNGDTIALDLRNLTDYRQDTFINFYAFSNTEYVIPRGACNRLLLPNTFVYSAYFLHSMDGLRGGLYLSQHYTRTNNSKWIYGSVLEGRVKNPPNSDVPYYLQFISISADDMVGIFNNMIDRSKQSGTKTITLGENNLAKLTDEQKQIAYAKGWNLA